MPALLLLATQGDEAHGVISALCGLLQPLAGLLWGNAESIESSYTTTTHAPIMSPASFLQVSDLVIKEDFVP